MPRLLPSKIQRAREQAVYRAVKEGMKLEPIIAAYPYVFSPSGNTTAGYNAAMNQLCKLVRAGYIDKIGPGLYGITEEDYKLDDVIEDISAADYETVEHDDVAILRFDPPQPKLHTPPLSPQEDEREWGPHDLLLWLSSMKGVERRELVKRLKPDMVDKAVAACKRLMPVQNIAQNS